MALSAVVSKVSVTTTQDKLYSISLKLTLEDTVGAGFIKDYTCEYRTGENVSNKVQGFISDMQNDIDKYKAGQSVFNSVTLDTAVTNIQNGLVL